MIRFIEKKRFRMSRERKRNYFDVLVWEYRSPKTAHHGNPQIRESVVLIKKVACNKNIERD